MNKKIALILALALTATTVFVGCGSKTKTDSASSLDTNSEVSSVEEDNSADLAEDSEQKDTEGTESKDVDKTGSANNNKKQVQSNDNKSAQNNDSKSSKNNNNKPANNNNNSSANKSKDTSNSTKKEEKPANAKSTTYTSKEGYSITFPASWYGKYEIEEKSGVLKVVYKCSKDKSSGKPWIFSIERADIVGDELDHFDSVGDIRSFNVGNTKYYVGGPTDSGISENSPDLADYQALKRQCGEVVNSIKVIK